MLHGENTTKLSLVMDAKDSSKEMQKRGINWNVHHLEVAVMLIEETEQVVNTAD